MIRVAHLVACLASAALVDAAPILPGQFFSMLNTGTLAGVTFPVSFSYDAGQINPAGDSFIALASIDFTFMGVAFNKGNILQGGQVIFRNGVLENVTASFQAGPLPPNSPVNNITFGFGGPGVIGYADLQNNFGRGNFVFVPEPSGTEIVALACVFWLWASERFGRRSRPSKNRLRQRANAGTPFQQQHEEGKRP